MRYLRPGDWDARFQLACHFLANTLIGVSLYFWVQMSAENVLNGWLPPWFWPVMFCIAGVSALFGFRSVFMARFSFFFAAAVTAVFGLLSLYAVVTRDAYQAIPSAVFLLYIAELKVMIARYATRQERILETITENTERGRSVLDRVSDGPAS